MIELLCQSFHLLESFQVQFLTYCMLNMPLVQKNEYTTSGSHQNPKGCTVEFIGVEPGNNFRAI